MSHQHDERGEEDLVRLNWVGPFSYGEDGLDESLLDRFGPKGKKKKLAKLVGNPGLYVILGDHPVHGPRTLLYIGESKAIQKRFEGHDVWVRDEWRVEVYLAEFDEPRRTDVESILIYIHSPVYNSSKVSDPPTFSKPLRVLNEGRYWKLLPEISSRHEWCQPYS